MKKPIYETVRYFGENTEYASHKAIIGYEMISRLGASQKKNSRPKMYGRKLSNGFKK
ncbi:hypothetical protein [Lactococcus garvieae]|uniref:hypothetical protein n=1 Tax=Lactococcus garvieae TaxID=1363 RepID=UPI003852E23E